MQSVALCCAALAAVPPMGPHAVEQSHIEMPLPSGPSSKRITIHFPVDLENGPYPVVSFAHGMLAGGPTGRFVYTHLVRSIVSRGFVVVAPESCLLAYCNNFYKDQLVAIAATRNASLHEVFKHVDTSAVGVVGHSMGGEATERSAGELGYNITAAVGMHPVSNAKWGGEVKVPILYTSGNLDLQVPARTVHAAFNATPVSGSWFAELKGANHYEPTDLSSGRLDTYAAVFLECHVKKNNTACEYFQQNICEAYNYVACTSK